MSPQAERVQCHPTTKRMKASDIDRNLRVILDADAHKNTPTTSFLSLFQIVPEHKPSFQLYRARRCELDVNSELRSFYYTAKCDMYTQFGLRMGTEPKSCAKLVPK